MLELYENIYQEKIQYEDYHISPRNLYVVRGADRSLMVDTSFRREKDYEILARMIEKLGIDYKKLDIFITHDHPDHSGLVPDLSMRGARIFMNPEETKKRADLLHCYLSDDAARKVNLRTVGVTPEDTPEVYQAIMEYTNRAHEERRELPDFDFVPVQVGDILPYGPYQFQVISLKGHTFGQCGLYEPNHQLMFCGDQIMTDIVPIVGSQQKDLGLLKCYLESLHDLKHNYQTCWMLPCHYDAIENVGREVDRITMGYIDKCTIMKQILESSNTPLTTRDVGVRAYGRSQGPPDYRRFFSCAQIWAKTFSCLEYMYGQGFIERSDVGGILYWSNKG